MAGIVGPPGHGSRQSSRRTELYSFSAEDLECRISVVLSA